MTIDEKAYAEAVAEGVRKAARDSIFSDLSRYSFEWGGVASRSMREGVERATQSFLRENKAEIIAAIASEVAGARLDVAA